MDATNPSAALPFAVQTPLHVGAVGLKVRDLDRLTAFYRDVIGLAVLEHGAGRARLGAGGVTLLELEHVPHAKPDNPAEAGLFHTAFLQPTRADLARWLIHVARQRVPLSGASDHAVSEAIYLDDPEGNGIEVYRDRGADEWSWEGELIRMTTERLDLDALAEAAGADQEYRGAPEAFRIGHIHLRVGELGQAEGFYRGVIGLELTRRRHGASFMSSGRYHHHVAGNVWHSNGAAARDPDRAGLAWFSLQAADAETRNALTARIEEAGLPAQRTGDALETADPWGTRVRVL
jgi:catechol 2,3-dioxygenase